MGAFWVIARTRRVIWQSSAAHIDDLHQCNRVHGATGAIKGHGNKPIRMSLLIS